MGGWCCLIFPRITRISRIGNGYDVGRMARSGFSRRRRDTETKAAVLGRHFDRTGLTTNVVIKSLVDQSIVIG
jgi:hypothetical protein